jgi:ceramide glucosyltransferase
MALNYTFPGGLGFKPSGGFSAKWQRRSGRGTLRGSFEAKEQAMFSMHAIIVASAWFLAVLGSITSTIFLAMVAVAAARYLRTAGRAQNCASTQSLPPVTILKPLRGMELQLENNLESFFRQDYPEFDIVFGTRSWEDPALRVVAGLCAKYPQVATKIVVSGEPFWPNAKVFSLSKMLAVSAASSHFVISDSDVLVGPDFLRRVVPPLLNSKIGLVTCLYRGIPAQDLWSKLEALGMTVEMTSGVLVANMLEGMKFAMGAVMALRRDALEAIGGIRSLADYCADDFLLGNRIAKAGYQVVLSDYKVEHVLPGRTLQQSFSDQLRWMKSTRFSRPRGHIGSGLTYAIPFGLLALLPAIGHPHRMQLGIELFALACANRILLSLISGWLVMRDPRALWRCWLYPLRDLAGFLVWAASFCGRTFRWRGESYHLESDGRLAPEQRRFELVGATQPQGHD